MARRFSGGTSDKVECAVAFTTGPTVILTPPDRDFTAFILGQRTGSQDFQLWLTVSGSTADGWHLGTDSGANNDRLYAVARGIGSIDSGIDIPLDTTFAMAVRWEVGVQATFWLHPEGGSVSGGTPVSSSTTPSTPSDANAVRITVGNQISTASQNLAVPGDYQFAGIVEGLCTDTEVTDTLTALLAGDFSVPSGFDERFWMSLSPGGVATSPEDDTSPNNQDGTVTGTSAVADLIAASGGGSATLTAAAGSFTETGVAATLKAARKLAAAAGSFSLTGQDVTLTGPGSKTLTAGTGSFTLTGQDVNFELAVEAGTASYTLTGQTVGLKVGRKIAPAAGSFSLTGQSVTLSRGHGLATAAGTFSLTGIDLGLAVARKLAMSAGSFAMTGRVATLTWSGAAVASSPGTATLSNTGPSATLSNRP